MVNYVWGGGLWGGEMWVPKVIKWVFHCDWNILMI